MAGYAAAPHAPAYAERPQLQKDRLASLKKKEEEGGCYITHPNLVAGLTKITLLSLI